MNIYKRTDNISSRAFFKCPINSTHNTLIRHRSLLRESVMTELNCRVIEIVLSTLKYPVLWNDMKGNEAKSAAVDAGADAAGEEDCNPRRTLGHKWFTGTSKSLDFLTTVCQAYSKA